MYINLLWVHWDPSHTGAGLSVVFHAAGREQRGGRLPQPHEQAPQAWLLLSAAKAGGSTGQIIMPESMLMSHVY